MSNEFDESHTVASTLIYKIPFLLLGIAVGMIVVWVALHWVPRALLSAVAAANQ